MLSFNEFFSRRLLQESVQNFLLEYEVYRPIPGTKNFYRQDSANTNTLTQKHCHVYVKPDGKGKQLYAVNFDGSGHDGSSGYQMPHSHGVYLRGMGYSIPDTNILESIGPDVVLAGNYVLIIFDEDLVVASSGSVSLLNE